MQYSNPTNAADPWVWIDQRVTNKIMTAEYENNKIVDEKNNNRLATAQ